MHTEDPAAGYYNPHRLFTGAIIPNWLLAQPTLSSGAKLCFARLCQYAGEDGECWPAQATLAGELGLNVRQVRRLLRELADAGLIAVKTGTGRRASAYRFLRHPWMDGAGTLPPRPSGTPAREPPARHPRPPKTGRPAPAPKPPGTPAPADPALCGPSRSPRADVVGAPGGPPASGRIK